jgi:hypothetical protein
MAPKINPSSIHLGKDQGAPPQVPADNRYFADYFPAPAKEDQPVSCALPPEIPPLFPPKLPLEPLEPSCEFTFPDVTPIPPVFNPKIELPCVCEQLEATVDIRLENFSEGSYIRMSTGGPNNCVSQEASECTINLEGFLKPPPACPTTELNVAGRFGKAFTGNSKLNVQREDDCAHTIIYDFDINVCETFAADVCPGGISFGSGFKPGSNLTLTPKSAPDCGVELCGKLDLDVCVDLEVQGELCVTGNAVTRNDIKIEALTNNATGGVCGIGIGGCLDINACIEVEVEGDFCVTGNAVTKNDLAIRPLTNKAGEACGVEVAGCLDINACVDFTVIGELCVTGGLVANNTLVIQPIQQTNDSLVCGIELGGCVELFDACTEFNPVINIDVSLGSAEFSETSITVNGPPDCGFEYDSKIKVKGCPSICVDGEPRITSPKDIFGQNSLRLVPMPQDDECCKLEWQGELSINAFPCPEYNPTFSMCAVPVAIGFQGGVYRSSINFEVEKTGDQCNPQTRVCAPQGVAINLPPIEIPQIPCIPIVIVEKMCWPPDDNCGTQGCPEEGSLFVRKKFQQTFGEKPKQEQPAVQEEENKVFEIKFEEIIEIRRCASCEELKIVFYFIRKKFQLCVPDMLVNVKMLDEKGAEGDQAPVVIKSPKTDKDPEGKELARMDMAQIVGVSVRDVDGCTKQLDITLKGLEVEMTGGAGFELSEGDYTNAIATTDGCVWDDSDEDNQIRLGLDENNKLKMFGKLPIPCFSCRDNDGTRPYEFSEITLDLLAVNRILPPVGALGECCDTQSSNQLNMCQGFLEFEFEGEGGYYCKESIEFWNGDSGGTAKLERSKLTIYADDDQNQADVTGDEIRVGNLSENRMVTLSQVGIDIAGAQRAIRLKPEDIPADAQGDPMWREIQICSNGVISKAYVFMTEPVEVSSGASGAT